MLKGVNYYSTLESLVCFCAIFGHLCVFPVRVCRAGVPDLPAEEDRCSLSASERREGGEEPVCQRGTVRTQQFHVWNLSSTERPMVPPVVSQPTERLNKVILSLCLVEKAHAQVKGLTDMLFFFAFDYLFRLQFLIQLSVLACLTVHQDLQHRLERDQLQI